MVEGLKERFASVRKKNELNVKKFAESLNMEATTVSSIESGKREPSKDVLLKLTSKFEINLHWMLTGEGEMFLSSSKSITTPEQGIVKHGEGYKIPLLRQKVSCGPGEDWQTEENIKEYIDIFSLIPKLGNGKHYAFPATGTSMLGVGIKDGDILIFNADQRGLPRDGTYVFSLDGDLYCKRLEFDKLAGRLKIFSVRVAELDKAELVRTIDMTDAAQTDSFRIFGRVVHIWRPLRDD
jgi:SOS-response transcriptional repressor LexA